MKHCKDAAHEGENPLPLAEFYRSPCTYDGRQSFCKTCQKRRSAVQVKRRRCDLASIGLPARSKETTHAEDVSERFIEKHLQKREQERELEAALERVERGQQPNAGEMSFADIEFNSLNPPPVFRDQINSMLRQQQRTFGWSVR